MAQCGIVKQKKAIWEKLRTSEQNLDISDYQKSVLLRPCDECAC